MAQIRDFFCSNPTYGFSDFQGSDRKPKSQKNIFLTMFLCYWYIEPGAAAADIGAAAPYIGAIVVYIGAATAYTITLSQLISELLQLVSNLPQLISEMP